MKEDKSLDKLKTKNYSFEFIKGDIANSDFPEELISFAIAKYNSLIFLLLCRNNASIKWKIMMMSH